MSVTTVISDRTAETQFVEATGIDFAHRRFGRQAELPLVVLQHYPDAAHGFLFQYPTEVAAEVNEFLTADDENVPSSPRRST